MNLASMFGDTKCLPTRCMHADMSVHVTTLAVISDTVRATDVTKRPLTHCGRGS